MTPSMRRQGVGRALVRAAEDWGREGAGSLGLTHNSTTAPALRRTSRSASTMPAPCAPSGKNCRGETTCPLFPIPNGSVFSAQARWARRWPRGSLPTATRRGSGPARRASWPSSPAAPGSRRNLFLGGRLGRGRGAGGAGDRRAGGNRSRRPRQSQWQAGDRHHQPHQRRPAGGRCASLFHGAQRVADGAAAGGAPPDCVRQGVQ